MKIGILGGSFNPPHLGHIYVSELALKKLRLNQIWWIPTIQNPLKDLAQYQSYEQRLKKCRQIIGDKNFIKLCPKQEIYSYLMLRQLLKTHKNKRFFWIMGADNLQNLHRWKEFKKFLKIANITIFSRENFLPKIRKTKAWKFIDQKKCQILVTKNLNISSTKIRNLS